MAAAKEEEEELRSKWIAALGGEAVRKEMLVARRRRKDEDTANDEAARSCEGKKGAALAERIADSILSKAKDVLAKKRKAEKDKKGFDRV